MLEDAQDAIKFANKVGSADALASNRLYRKAVVMSILNIGELTKHLSDEFKIDSRLRIVIFHGRRFPVCAISQLMGTVKWMMTSYGM